jgi:hypothetical protein
MLHNTVRNTRSPQSTFPQSSRSPLSLSISRLTVNEVAAFFNYLLAIALSFIFLASLDLIISASRKCSATFYHHPHFILGDREKTPSKDKKISLLRLLNYSTAFPELPCDSPLSRSLSRKKWTLDD